MKTLVSRSIRQELGATEDDLIAPGIAIAITSASGVGTTLTTISSSPG